MTRSPLLVEVTRGDRIESRHEVDAVVVDSLGRLVGSWGEPHRSVLPRSALKPIQALPLVDTGAADAFGLGRAELALACASHNGEAAHIRAVEAWLGRIGCTVDDLSCGAHAPLGEAAAAGLAASGRAPTAAHNNCSGKHAGFLTVCRHLDLPVEGYLAPDHPLHRDHVTPALEAALGIDASGQRPGIDGCGIPVWAAPLDRLAAGWAGLSMGEEGRRLLAAMTAEPFLVAGTGRACTRLISATDGEAVVKAGAEGVFCGVLPDSGTGIALKVRDGASRAADAAVAWLLARCGVLAEEGPMPLGNRAGTMVGGVRVVG